MRNFTLFLFVIIFEVILWVTSRQSFVPDPLLLVALAFASSLAGRAVAYMTVFEWLRAPFTEITKHSSGVGESVEPRKDRGRIIEVIGTWMCCPVCAGTWAALLLHTLYIFYPEWGQTTIYVLAAAGAGSILTRYVEAREWEGRLAWERTGFMNLYNIDNRLKREWQQVEAILKAREKDERDYSPADDRLPVKP
ncbi:MAG TPA: DUF1360 domain-containing protein [Bellilinea sp.]|nr:DUF1360 domain-containing protein [Bellilinea sp.]